MMKAKKDRFTFYKPNKKQPVWKVVKPVLKNLFYNKFEVINLAGEIDKKSVLVGNHEGKKGPLVYELYLPLFSVKWGAYGMLGNYRDRYNYLRNVLYIQKYKKGKFISTIKASFEAIFSKLFYRGIKVLPSFPDARVLKTFTYSVEVLDGNNAVMVYPEDSNDGYFEKPKKFFNGFVGLCEYYYKKRGEDLPVYPTYLHLKKKMLVIGKPFRVNELKNQGMTRSQIAEFFKDQVNALFDDYVKDKNKK